MQQVQLAGVIWCWWLKWYQVCLSSLSDEFNITKRWIYLKEREKDAEAMVVVMLVVMP